MAALWRRRGHVPVLIPFENETDFSIRRPHFKPSLLTVGRIHRDLEAELRPEVHGAILIFDLDHDLVDGKHADLSPLFLVFDAPELVYPY